MQNGGAEKCFMTSWWNMKNGTQKRKLASIEDEAKHIVVAAAKKKNGLSVLYHSLWRGEGWKNTEEIIVEELTYTVHLSLVKLVSAFKNHNSYYSVDLIFAFKISLYISYVD